MAWKPAYATTADLRSWLGVPAPGGSPTADEALDTTNMTLALEAASRSVDRFCLRQFGLLASATERLYTAEWSAFHSAHEVTIDDLMTSTGLVITSAGTTITDYTLLPLNAPGNGMPWDRIRFGESVSTVLGELSVTARYGWTTVPDTIKTATLIQASRIFKRKDSPFGIAGSPDMGSEQRLLAKLDPDVAVMCREYRRWWAAQ